MATTVRRAADITVGLPREQALALFTPEGERRWAEGWDPQYPEPGRRKGPGAVFTTRHGGHETTWITIDQRPLRGLPRALCLPSNSNKGATMSDDNSRALQVALAYYHAWTGKD